MKKVSKEIKIVTKLVILALVFLSAISFVYAYFTASAIISGDLEFNQFDVSLNYTSNSITTQIAKTNAGNVNTLTLYPSLNSVARGVVFNLQTQSSVDVDLVSIKTANNSTSAYVRFWIDAFIVDDGVVDTTVNYAQYFTLGYRQTVSGVTSVVVPNTVYRNVYDMGDQDGTTNLVTYYIKNSLAANASADCFDAIQFDENAPSVLLGKSIKLTLSFEAVQSTNNAYKLAFDVQTNPNYRGASYWGLI